MQSNEKLGKLEANDILQIYGWQWYDFTRDPVHESKSYPEF